MKILVATEKPFAAAAVDGIKKEAQAAGHEVVMLEKYTEKQQLLDAVADADAAIIRSDKFTADVFDAAKNLKIVVRAGAGYDTIDLAAATAHGVVAENTPGQNSNAVAELVFGMLVFAVVRLDIPCQQDHDRLPVHQEGHAFRDPRGLRSDSLRRQFHRCAGLLRHDDTVLQIPFLQIIPDSVHRHFHGSLPPLPALSVHDQVKVVVARCHCLFVFENDHDDLIAVNVLSELIDHIGHVVLVVEGLAEGLPVDISDFLPRRSHLDPVERQLRIRLLARHLDPPDGAVPDRHVVIRVVRDVDPDAVERAPVFQAAAALSSRTDDNVIPAELRAFHFQAFKGRRDTDRQVSRRHHMLAFLLVADHRRLRFRLFRGCSLRLC